MTVNSDTATIAQLLSSKQLIVFDFDGVLADSVEVKTESFAKLYEPYGADVVSQVVSHHRNHGGMSRFEKFRFYHREFVGEAIDERRVAELADAFSALVKQAVIAAPEIPGALMTLKALCDLGKMCAVNSATPEKEIIDIVRQRSLSKYIARVYGSPSSKKENLEKIIHDCSIPIENTVFFGDARSDLDASLALGVDFIGVGECIRRELGALDACFCYIADFHGLNSSLY